MLDLLGEKPATLTPRVRDMHAAAARLSVAHGEVLATETHARAARHEARRRHSLEHEIARSSVAFQRCERHLAHQNDALRTRLLGLPRPAVVGVQFGAQHVYAKLRSAREQREAAMQEACRTLDADLSSVREAIAKEREARRANEETLRRLVDEVAAALQRGVGEERKARSLLQRSAVARGGVPAAAPTTPSRRQAEMARDATPVTTSWSVAHDLG